MAKKTCSKCGKKKEPSRGIQRYCRSCHAAYMRENRKRHYELDPLAKKKANARSYARVYLRRGVIQKKPCRVCGSSDSEMHHPDYEKPLKIEWLCRAHHLETHADSKGRISQQQPPD